MNRISRFVAQRYRLAFAFAIVLAVSAGWLASQIAVGLREQMRLDRLEHDAERLGFEFMSQTLNGDRMGALGLLGILDETFKQEATGKRAPNGPDVSRTLEMISRAHGSEGAFLVGQDSVIKSSWGVGPSLTGVDVKFRPYARMALRGTNTIYAAIGTTTGRRTLYFAAPMFAAVSPGGDVIGAVVERSGVEELDRMLAGKADVALLLSPQALVFASSRPDWIGRLAGPSTPERVAAIRELRQFGRMFDERAPDALPLPASPGVHFHDGKRLAVATATVNWNDPTGDWTLALIEDLGRTAPVDEATSIAVATGCVVMLIGLLMLIALRAHHAQAVAAGELGAYAQAQKAHAEHKTRLAAAAVRMQQAQNLEELARLFLTQAHAMLEMLQGAVYIADRSGQGLHLAASYACAEPPPAWIARGEGLLGQCMEDRRMQVLEISGERFWLIRSGLGETKPAAVMIAPVAHGDALLGVVEIASMRTADAGMREQFDELCSLLAINVEIIGRAEASQGDGLPPESRA